MWNVFLTYHLLQYFLKEHQKVIDNKMYREIRDAFEKNYFEIPYKIAHESHNIPVYLL